MRGMAMSVDGNDGEMAADSFVPECPPPPTRYAATRCPGCLRGPS